MTYTHGREKQKLRSKAKPLGENISMWSATEGSGVIFTSLKSWMRR